MGDLISKQCLFCAQDKPEKVVPSLRSHINIKHLEMRNYEERRNRLLLKVFLDLSGYKLSAGLKLLSQSSEKKYGRL